MEIKSRVFWQIFAFKLNTGVVLNKHLFVLYSRIIFIDKKCNRRIKKKTNLIDTFSLEQGT